MTAETASATSLQTKQRPWWLLLVEGILVFLVSAVLLWAPAKAKLETYQLLVAFLGIYWLVRGIFDLVSIFIDKSAWGWKLFMGIIGIMAGGYILMYPIAAQLALPKIFVLVLGIWGLIEGTILLIMAFMGGGWGAGILGALGIIFGIILIGTYSDFGSGLAMIWAAAVTGLIAGVVLVVQAFRQKSAG